MRPLIIALVSLGVMFGASVLAARLRPILPEHHLDDAARDVVSRGTGFVVTLAALVLSLLIAAGKTSQDEIVVKLRALAADFILVDRSLAAYGAETAPIRDLLRRTTASVTHSILLEVELSSPSLNGELPRVAIERLERMVLDLHPGDDAQRLLQAETLREISDIKHSGWLLIELSEARMPTIFLLILIVWLVIIFFGFGLFAPPNRTVNVALLFCAFCAAGAVFLILELYSPVSGMLAISPQSFEMTLQELGR